MRSRLGVLAAAAVAAGLTMGGLAPPAGAATEATVYAAPAGTGADCSSTAPCSLASAVAQANAGSGDTVVLAGGTYTGVDLTLTASMSLTAAPGAHPVLTGTGVNAANVIGVEAATVSVSGLTITGGQSGIETFPGAGSLTVSGSTLSGNSIGIEASTNVTVTGSTMVANVASGLALLGPPGTTASVTNSTITGNPTDGIDVDSDGALLTVVGTTFSDNGVYGLALEGDSDVSVGSSVFAGNADKGCASNSRSSVTDAGFNVESGNTCGFGSTSVTGVGDAAIGLGPLAANGSDGPQTQAIGTGSAAFLAVPASSNLCPKTDERGLPRPGAGTASCDAGAYELQRAAVTLTQGSPTSGTVAAGTAFAGQLAVTGALGAVTYTTTSPAGPVTVSASGAITAPASTPAGVYQLAGTVTDPAGDTGSWSFTLAVTSPGPARADLSLTLTAPAQVHPGSQATVTITVRNAGLSAAARTGTALLIPRGWTLASPGSGTLIGRQLLTFTTASVAAKGSVTYTITLTAPAAKGLALLPAATASVTADPSYRNNVALALTQVR
jgi:hypothetical protein